LNGYYGHDTNNCHLDDKSCKEAGHELDDDGNYLPLKSTFKQMSITHDFFSDSQKLTRMTHPFPHFYIVFIYYWACSRPGYSWKTDRWTLIHNQSINQSIYSWKCGKVNSVHGISLFQHKSWEANKVHYIYKRLWNNHSYILKLQ
jgi:hypothetical protein